MQSTRGSTPPVAAGTDVLVAPDDDDAFEDGLEEEHAAAVSASSAATAAQRRRSNRDRAISLSTHPLAASHTRGRANLVPERYEDEGGDRALRRSRRSGARSGPVLARHRALPRTAV